MGALIEHLCTCVIISRSILPRMRNISGTNCRENQNTHFMFNNFFFFFENRAVSEIMWKNTVDPERTHDDMAHAYCMLDT